MVLKKILSHGDILYKRIVSVISSRYFFFVILGILILEAVWYAFSFQPTINDELKHLGNIYFYAQHITPFVDHQPKQWDFLGDVTRNGAYMYYYLMSWPFRLVEWITSNVMAQVIVLRLINTVFVIGGIIYFKKALKLVGGLSDAVLHLLFLFFALTPAVALLAGTVNYDNLVFLLFAYLLFLSIKIVTSKKLNILDLSLFVSVGLLMTVVKWTAICLLIPMALFIAFDIYKSHKKKLIADIFQAGQKLSKLQLTLISLCLVISVGLFIERPVVNYLQYGKVNPKCQKVLSEERCLSYPDYAIYKTIRANKPADFEPVNPIYYVTNFWAPKMITSSTNLLERSSTQLKSAVILYTLIAAAGILIFLLCAREIMQRMDKGTAMLLMVLIVYVLFLLAGEYASYIRNGMPTAIRARYLIPILPIAGYFIALSVMILFGRFKRLLLIGAIGLLILMSQGAGIATYATTTPPNIYWQNKSVQAVNRWISDLFRVIVIKA